MKKKPFRENSRFLAREKNPPMREKTFESARENARLSVKFFKNLCVKNRFFPWKKSKNRQKSVSRTLFFFTHKKKNTDSLRHETLSLFAADLLLP